MDNPTRPLDREFLTSGEAAPGLPVFCLERWQSTLENSAKYLLSESGVEPPAAEMLIQLGVDLDVRSAVLGYGWTLGEPGLRESVASVYYRGLVDSEQVIITTGSAEANLLSVISLVAPGDRVIFDMPNYMQIHGLLRMRGARILEAWRKREHGWKLDPGLYAELLRREKPRAVFITNPNNPTGSVAGHKALSEIAAEAARAGSILVFDELYRGLEHSTEPAPTILEPALEHGAHSISVSGLSKVYGLPGLRIGWAAATSRRLRDRLWMVKDYTTISPPKPSENIARQILEKGVWTKLAERGRRIVLSNLEILEDLTTRFRTAKLWRPDAGAYALVETTVGDTLSFAYKLYQTHSILVNPGECFKLPGTIRLGLGHENRESFKKSVALTLNFLESFTG
ncbi:aspartate aminotransferase [Aeropyrum pernix]|uniref:Aminotransferase n=1 Tax=Aeropyrum pernix TaxID=56636 RepID=A0A401HC17_AERPX|nr:pyridoxal phosphate-dependent aminotransferase [Aeropyrum pernix]GBF09963.1 aspartate aminotransferase [Aeropyrum pernix]